jgi:HicA toxin of bacterial toxin-antitoxin,
MIQVNNKHRRTLEAVWTDPVNGNIKWLRIELLLIALGCRVVEGPGSSVTFEWQGRRATFHRPHPGKEALRYRVKATREFLEYMRIKP